MIIIKQYEGYNLDELQFLGEGTQGKVYRIDSQRCIKIFKDKRTCKEELKTLVISQGDEHFPRLYGNGENYIVREFIDGIELNKYLSTSQLTPYISLEIIKLYEAMQGVGFTRLDCGLLHIFILPSGDLKLIDTAKMLKKRTTYPAIILGGLKQLGYKDEFLDFVKCSRPYLYNKWIKHSN